MTAAVRALGVVVSAALIASACPASAQEAEAASTAACADQVRAIAAALDRDARRTGVWYWSWMAAGVALIGGQAGLAIAVEGDQRTEFVAGAATSVLIPAILLIHPPMVLTDAAVLDARLQATTVGGVVGDPCIALARARELLARDAADEALATGWVAHTLAIGVNVGVGLLLGVVFGDWWGAAKQTVGGIAVGELQILTLPTGAKALGQSLGSGPAGLNLAASASTLAFGGTF